MNSISSNDTTINENIHTKWSTRLRYTSSEFLATIDRREPGGRHALYSLAQRFPA